MGVDAEPYYVKHAGYCMDVKLLIMLLTIVPSSFSWNASILLAFKFPWVIEKISYNIPLIVASCFLFWLCLTLICGSVSSLICPFSFSFTSCIWRLSHLLLLSLFLFVLPSLVFRHLNVLFSLFIISFLLMQWKQSAKCFLTSILQNVNNHNL